MASDRRPPSWANSDEPCDMCGRRKKDHPPWQDEYSDCAEQGFWGESGDPDYIPPVEQEST